MARDDVTIPQFEEGDLSRLACKDTKEHSSSSLLEVLVQYATGGTKKYLEVEEGEVVEQIGFITGTVNETSKPMEGQA